MTTTTTTPTPVTRTVPRPAMTRSGKPESDAPTAGRLLTWLKLYWLTICFCGSLLGCGMAYLAWELLPAKYESYGMLRVASAPFSVSNQRDPSRTRTDFNTYLKTNAKLIRNEFVLNKALGMEIDGVRIIDLPTIKAEENPIKFLEEELIVTTTEGVEIITITMKGHRPEDIRRIVNAVQAAYMEQVIEKEILERQAFLTTVETTLVRLQQDLAKMVGKPGEAGAPANLVQAGNTVPGVLPGNVINAAAANTPPDWVKKEMAQNVVRKAALLRENIAELPLVITSQKKKLESLQTQLAALKAGPPSKEVQEEVEHDPEVKAVADREKAYRARYQREMALYSNPEAESVKATLTLANQAAAELKTVKEKKLFDKESGKRQGRANELAILVDEAGRRLRDYEDKLRADTVRLAENEAEIAKMPPDIVQAKMEMMKKEEDKKALVNPDTTMILAQDDIFRDIAHHAAALRMDIGSPKRVSILQKASTPMQKDQKKQILATAFAAMLGFGLVGFGVIGYESRAKKISTLSDIKSTSSSPIVGVVPWQPGESTSTPDVAEAIDKLRCYVAQTWLARGATTVCVTCPIGDEGKAFTAFGVASSLAQSGLKTLLVDFDLREPSLHNLAGVANTSGVCELVRGEADFRGTIQRLPSGLHFLPAGKWSDDARQAVVGSRLESLVSRLKEPFDCVVLHCHALLTAAETVEVARRCEAVLLCTLSRETRMPLVKRATERLTTLEVPYTGVVYLGATSHEALC
ncbi:hypothetical protein BH11PLA2_BH11PLA2_30380 [soil metagenome]